ncbi:RusA family crossover junction endodeoxyribonuclease [Neisseria sp. Ec49-e6-T10]|uniref:RusA family crossover junction endodeoxyribonuclease n=1 Tax=Neisseria sp. Ec49-e6-T10 TaxID=3140744 RepID=UPI003EB8B779
MDGWKMSTIIILPFPDSKLMPNRKNGRSWASTAKEKKSSKDEGYYITLLAGLKGAKIKPGMKVMFYQPDNRKRDLDNLYAAMKHAQDGMMMAIGMDDSILRPVVLDKTVDRNNPRVEITLEIEQ